MLDEYLIHAGKLVTVSDKGTIDNGGMAIGSGTILAVGEISELQNQYPELPVKDFSDYVITPSLVDCHTHLLEFGPASLYPITEHTHFLAAKSILFHALTAGITAIGEQICGHPDCNFSIDKYRNAVEDFPMDISLAATSISIGFKNLAHFTSVTKSRAVNQEDLMNPIIVNEMAGQNEYPGENLFINATPANFTAKDVPRAGEIIYTINELRSIVEIFHEKDKRIGVHVAGEKGIKLALDAGVDVLHHAHGITDKQVKEVHKRNVAVVATPLGGTHLEPNSPENILKLVEHDIEVSIATDAYLPPYPDVSWLNFSDHVLQGPDVLMEIAQPSMKLLYAKGFNENEALALLTANPAAILEKGEKFGRLKKRMNANFLVAEGIPGLEITSIEAIKRVYINGNCVADRGCL